MVTEGVTGCVALALTVPIPWLMVTVSAPVELQESVAETPSHMLVVSASMLTVGRAFTVMVALSVTDP